MPLFAVDAAEVAAILQLPVPPHRATFDGDALRSLIARSFSLTADEKRRLIQRLSTMPQRGVDALARILTDEAAAFERINRESDRRMADAEAVHRRRTFRLV